MAVSRRQLMKSSLIAGSAASLPAISYGRVIGSNETIRCGVIGLNGRGKKSH